MMDFGSKPKNYKIKKSNSYFYLSNFVVKEKGISQTTKTKVETLNGSDYKSIVQTVSDGMQYNYKQNDHQRPYNCKRRAGRSSKDVFKKIF